MNQRRSAFEDSPRYVDLHETFEEGTVTATKYSEAMLLVYSRTNRAMFLAAFQRRRRRIRNKFEERDGCGGRWFGHPDAEILQEV